MNEAADIGRDLIVIFVLVMVFAWVLVILGVDEDNQTTEHVQDPREVSYD
jgi:hypothetical protein